MVTHTTTQYLGIANSLALVATFAGAFTYSNVITIKTQPQPGKGKEEFGSQTTLLSLSFILFIGGLFVTIFVQTILRTCGPEERLTGRAHKVTQLSLLITAGLLAAGFILLHIILIGFGQIAIGVVGICLVGIVGAAFTIVGFCGAGDGGAGAGGAGAGGAGAGGAGAGGADGARV